MTWRNLAFAAINPQFALFVAGLAIFSAWLLHFGSLVLETTLADLRALPLGRAVYAFLQLLVVTPWPLLVIVGIGGAFVYFADHKNWTKRISTGVAHGAGARPRISDHLVRFWRATCRECWLNDLLGRGAHGSVCGARQSDDLRDIPSHRTQRSFFFFASLERSVFLCGSKTTKDFFGSRSISAEI